MYWDASLSGKDRHIQKEIRLIEDYVRDSAIKQITIITFANEIIEEREFSGNSSAEIAAYLQSIAYDGATDFTKLDLKAEGFDQVILCSDGIQSLGNGNKETGNTPIYVLNSTTGSAYDLLKHWCTLSGGDFINLENTSSVDSLARLSEVPIHFIGHDQPELKEFYISHIANGQFQINGIMHGHSAHLNLKFGYGNELAFTVPV